MRAGGGAHMPGSSGLFIFHFIGAFSVVSLVLLAGGLIQLHLAGERPAWQSLIHRYPGMEPFVIFIGPVILIAGMAWLRRMLPQFRGILRTSSKHRHFAPTEKKENSNG